MLPQCWQHRIHLHRAWNRLHQMDQGDEAGRTDGVPYIVWGHSVGTWVGFEFLMLARKIGLPMPKAAFFMTFPAPHMPESKRPWQQSAKLTSDQMKEEVMAWDKT